MSLNNNADIPAQDGQTVNSAAAQAAPESVLGDPMPPNSIPLYAGQRADSGEKTDWKTADFVAACAALALGYALMKTVFFSAGGIGLGVTLFLFAANALSFIYMKVKKTPFEGRFLIYAVLSAVFAAAPTIYANGTVSFIAFLYSLLLFAYAVFVAGGNRAEKGLGTQLPFDAVKMTAVMPFRGFGNIFGAIGSVSKSRKKYSELIWIPVGLVAAVIPTIIVAVLLSSADAAFSNLFDRIFSALTFDVFRELMIFALGLPAACAMFCFLYSCSARRNADIMTPEKNKAASDSAAILPPALVYTAVAPLMLLYLLFFISQFAYFTSAFSGLVPDGITYAEYARRGFFELCAVSGINGIVIAVVSLLTRRREGGASKVTKAYIITLVVMTLALIATAVSKMAMYINNMGLTQLRVYTTWFMVLLALVFIWVMIRQFAPRFNAVKACFVTLTVMLALLVFSDSDALVARYNVDAYTSGRLETVDIGMMYELSDSAVKYVLPLTEDSDAQVRAEAREYIETKKAELKSSGVISFNFTSAEAERLLENAV